MTGSVFGARLSALQGEPRAARARRWIYAPYDQLSDSLGSLSRERPEDLGLVLVESTWKAARRPYHRQKLALVLANQRHFALEQAARGVAVRYVATDGPYEEALAPLARELGPLVVMEPAERELRVALGPLVAAGALQVLPHEGWLTTTAQFDASQGDGPQYRMDAFYRAVRRARGVLMDGGTPVGGKWSFDAENRRPWRGDPPAPAPPRFAPDDVTREVCALVERRFADHPGRLDPEALPATRADALHLLDRAVTACLPSFGPYEDALSEESGWLFHTRLAPVLNLHRVTPGEVLERVLAADGLPLASREGFVRQVLGWREFVRHVHRATDGFRALGGGSVPDEGRGARPSALGAEDPLPPAFWPASLGGAPSGLRCLDRVVAQVWDEGGTHHIARLMVLANVATLLAVSPRELTDWFWVAFTDAYDWVVEPNVLGMGTFAAGDVMTTKPYVCGAAYLDRMGDSCAACAFRPKVDCPLTPLYWDFLARNRGRLSSNPRLRMPYASLARRGPEQRADDARTAAHARAELAVGRTLAP